MSESRRLLPPIGALSSFVAAARAGSFSKAGVEIGLTQSAVSRQIAVLEEWVGASLFDRIGRGVELNADGRAYAETIENALDRIRGGTARLINRRPQSEVTIATLPSFGMRWLAPRLPRFSAEHSTFVVNFAARASSFVFADEMFDAAIHFGRADWPGADHQFLFREESIPICSPNWLAVNPIGKPSDLIGKPLLVQAYRREAWRQWFEAVGVEDVVAPLGPTFEHFLMLAQAAAAGAGVALIPKFLIAPELDSGTLVVPLDAPLSTEDAYYLVSPSGAPARPGLEAFQEWILREARA